MSMGLTLDHFFGLMGAFVSVMAVRIALDRGHPRRWGSAAFWLMLAVAIGGGKFLPAEFVGWLVLLMGGLAAAGKVAAPAFEPDGVARQARAARLGNRLLIPVLLVPVVAIVGSFFIGSQIALGLGCLLGIGAAMG